MIKQFKTLYVDTLPLKKDMEEGIVYVSERTWQSSHLCACGCGDEILTPLVRGGWKHVVNEKDEITLFPSVTSESCDSTYSINQGYAIL